MRTVHRSGRLGGVVCQEVSARGLGVSALGIHPPTLWTEFLTHACENISFPQLRLRMVKMSDISNTVCSRLSA